MHATGASSADPASAIRHALASYQAGRLDAAAAVCAAIVAAQPDHFDALHLGGLVAIARGDPASAIDLLATAARLRPRSPDAAHNLGVALQSSGDDAAALVQYERALALRPDFTEALVNRGNALRALGRPLDALASYEAALAQRSGDADAVNNRGAVLLDLGRPEEALASFTLAIAWRGAFAEAHLNRGNALRALGRDDEALASWDEVLRHQPGHGAALANMSAVLLQLDRPEEALAAALRALDRDPRQLDALVNRGVAAHKLGRPADAIAAYDAALRVAPDHAAALRNRAAAWRDMNRPVEALASLDHLLALHPDDPDALYERGQSLQSLGRLAEALANFERALAIAPDHALALGGAAATALNLCDWARAERLGDHIERRTLAGELVAPPFILLGLSGSPAVQQTGASNFARTFKPVSAPLHRPPADRSDKIRIAFMSADYREHPVGYLIADLIAGLDRARFEVHGVCIGRDDGSAVRAGLEASFDRFHRVRGETDAAAAQALREHRFDIAVDLTGYTQHCRPGILAARVAPIQVSYLGYSATMGADFIDYIVADAIVLPSAARRYVTEAIVDLPDCYLVNGRNRVVASVTPSREAAGLPARGFVFCAFNNAFKISRLMFDVWMRLLDRVAGSVLWLRVINAETRDHLRGAAAERGIAPDRLVFAEQVPLPEHFARHRAADLFLDTMPYNAHSTASDALWAGLPVLTCTGETFASRVGASLLTALGLPDLIASDLTAYEALALRLASEPDLLAERRRRLGDNRLTAPLFDIDAFCRHMEDAFATMYETWRRGAPPRSFTVAAP